MPNNKNNKLVRENQLQNEIEGTFLHETTHKHNIEIIFLKNNILIFRIFNGVTHHFILFSIR